MSDSLEAPEPAAEPGTRARDLPARGLGLLLARLGAEPEAGAEYRRLRQRLAEFFAWRGARFADELADEALERVARKLEGGEPVEHLRRYVYGVARHVLQEWRKRSARHQAPPADLLAPGPPTAEMERRVAGLETCLQELPAPARELIVAYYAGAGRQHLAERRHLAERLGLSYTALKTRAHRIRGLLERCLRQRLQAPHEGRR